MKILKSTKLFRGTSGKVLTVRPDVYIEPLPDVFMLQINALQGQTFTLPTPALTVTNYTDTYMEFYATKDGILLAFDDNSGYNYQPVINNQMLLANTEYYIKIKNGIGNSYNTPPHGYFGIQVTGGSNTGVPTPEDGVTVLPVGPVLQNQYLPYNPNGIWFKFKTDTAGYYTLKTVQATSYGSYRYTVDDWGDGTSSPLITTYNSPDRAHTYQTNGSFVIRITGTMPAFSVNNDNTIRVYITKCLSYGNVGLKRIDFWGCTALTNLPQQTGKLTGIIPPFYFNNFCYGCTSLTEIPYGTFLSTDGSPILEALSFKSAFYNCTAIRTINSLIFRDVPNVTDFSYTFQGCSKLITLPSKLFKNCYKITLLDYCFYNCSLLTNIPADLFYRSIQDIDYNLLGKTSMVGTFRNCSALTTVPSGMFSSPQLDNLGVNLVKLTGVSCIFMGCTSIVSVCDYTFHNQMYLTVCEAAFGGCTLLTYVPEGCFEGCITLQSAGSIYDSGYWGVFGRCNIQTISPTCFNECGAITNFNYLFSWNANLQNIPSNIFEDAVLCYGFTGVFYGTKISSIHNDLFKYNIKATTFTDCFNGCNYLTTIGDEVFRYNVDATNFNSTFQSCGLLKVLPAKLFRWNTKVTTFAQCFNSAKIEKIPVIEEDNVTYGFFHFNPLVTTFNATFSASNLFNSYGPFVPAIPELTFANNLQVTDFTRLFYSNINLESTAAFPLSANLFVNNTSVTLFKELFYGCVHANFNFLPNGFFSGNNNVSDFSYAFYQVKLTAIPADLFNNCPRVTTFAYCFYQTRIVEIPAGLFDVPGTSVTSFQHTFDACLQLLTAPTALFKFNINVTDFSYLFQSSGITIITDADMFRYNTLVTLFTSVFGSCQYLKSVPPLLFKYNTAVNNFSGAFQNCFRLVHNRNTFYADAEKTTKFLSRNINFSSCFNRTQYLGDNFLLDQTNLAKYWLGISVNSLNGDVYASVSSAGDIYKQTGGTGVFEALGQTARTWNGVAVNQTTLDVYACVGNGDIYKQTGGLGNFVALSAGNKNWSDIFVNHVNNDVYACVSAGDIWKQTAGSGPFVALGAGTKSWASVRVNTLNNDVYAVVSTSGDVWKQTAGSGAFVAQGLTARSYYGIAIDQSTGSVFVSVYSGDIYKQTNGSGAFVATGQVARSYGRMSFNQTSKALYVSAVSNYIFKRVEGAIGAVPDLWTCTFSFTPTSTACVAGAGNNAYTLSNFASVPAAWK